MKRQHEIHKILPEWTRLEWNGTNPPQPLGRWVGPPTQPRLKNLPSLIHSSTSRQSLGANSRSARAVAWASGWSAPKCSDSIANALLYNTSASSIRPSVRAQSPMSSRMLVTWVAQAGREKKEGPPASDVFLSPPHPARCPKERALSTQNHATAAVQQLFPFDWPWTIGYLDIIKCVDTISIPAC